MWLCGICLTEGCWKSCSTVAAPSKLLLARLLVLVLLLPRLKRRLQLKMRSKLALRLTLIEGW